VERWAGIFFGSRNQLNYLVPEAVTDGLASISVYYNGQIVATGSLRIRRVAPALFSANGNGEGVAAAVALKVAADGTQTSQLVFDGSAPEGQRSSAPVDLGEAGDQVYLLLFGTGLRGSAQQATATVGGETVGVAGPAPQGEFEGLDQANLGPLPRSLAGRGEVEIVLVVDGLEANRVTVQFR
ncbi:MAG: hypothetical protein GY953_14265, partial [bacterium]|nr:hypothetical protein [bacterium]